MWWRGKFAWEYKRKDKYKDLADAYRQLCQYREALESPPLLIVSDIARIQIHTNFTATRKEIHYVDLEHIAHPDNFAKLRRVFTDPHSFKPTLSTYRLTENAAAEFAKIADQMRQRGHDPHEAAHFLMKCTFCLFAEDVGLLPKGLFTTLLDHSRKDPQALPGRLNELFGAMRTGGHFGVANIKHFDGRLFDEAPALPLRSMDIHAMLIAAQFDWGAVEPSIFGTLFERSLDPSKRSQIGAHYTSREDIMLIVEPVVMAPLLREWDEVKQKVEKQLARRRKAATKETRRKADAAIEKLIDSFLHRLGSVRILDPACGSGNFLYVAIQELLALEKEVIVYAGKPEIALGLLPRVRPTQLHGIEINPYAAELAQVVIWIGYLQWMRDNGFVPPSDPILAPLQTIECRDAILAWENESRDTLPEWREGAKCTGSADWPLADFIIGNPPFLGSKLFRQYGLDDPYIEAMYANFELPNTSDLCCYWFELGLRAVAGSARYRGKGHHEIPHHRGRHHQDWPDVRVGLLATQGIRGRDNRKVLERIKETGDIFMAWSDREWILDGAHVHVSMVGFDDGTQKERTLDDRAVPQINANLTGDVDTTPAQVLGENASIAFMGDTKVGPFDIPWERARDLLSKPNPTERTNAEVIRPWINGRDLTRRRRAFWIVDFPPGIAEEDASRYEAPFEFILKHVRRMRKTARSGDATGVPWWIHQRPRPDMREAIEPLERFIVTTGVAKHRLFAWFENPTLPDHATFAFARADDYFFGVLHSSIHELGARRMGTQLREAESGFRYTPTTCFETFPLPWPPGSEPRPSASGRAQRRNGSKPLAHGRGSELHQRISEAARELNEQRERWLNPSEWIDMIARQVDRTDDFGDVPEEARPLIRQSAIMAEAARDPHLRKRTLTNLYNERPTWLRLAHEKLDRAVLAAYAGVDPDGDWSEDWAAVWVETGAGQPLPEDHPLAGKRKEIDQKVLANLLRLNLQRAGATRK